MIWEKLLKPFSLCMSPAAVRRKKDFRARWIDRVRNQLLMKPAVAPSIDFNRQTRIGWLRCCHGAEEQSRSSNTDWAWVWPHSMTELKRIVRLRQHLQTNKSPLYVSGTVTDCTWKRRVLDGKPKNCVIIAQLTTTARMTEAERAQITMQMSACCSGLVRKELHASHVGVTTYNIGLAYFISKRKACMYRVRRYDTCRYVLYLVQYILISGPSPAAIEYPYSGRSLNALALRILHQMLVTRGCITRTLWFIPASLYICTITY